MKKKIEKAYARALTGTLKSINPIKKRMITTDCEVHLFLQKNALETLSNNGYEKEYEFFNKYIENINEGLVWADQDFKSYHHFYNPTQQKGKYGYDDNALTVSKKYYNKAIKFYILENYEKSMFYFGAASHIIQDLTVPQHAKGKLFDNHRQFETYIKLNYKRIKKFKSKEEPLILNSIDDYANYNSTQALRLDDLYSHIRDNKTRFYFTAIKSMNLAQISSAGCMIMFYNELTNI